MKYTYFIGFLSLFIINFAFAVDDLPCSTSGDKDDSSAIAIIQCLEKKIDAVRSKNEISQQEILRLRETVAKQKFPEKGMIPVPAVKLYQTNAYWYQGNARKETLFQCQPELEPLEGMTLIGGSISDFKIVGRTRTGTCASSSWCDVDKEPCAVNSRAKGCFVKNDWYAFFQDYVGIVPTAEIACE